MMRNGLVTALAVLTFGTMCPAATESGVAQADPPQKQASVPNPTVTGPITRDQHGDPAFDAPFAVADYGYTEEEYFLSGQAAAYGTKAAPAPYTTRIVVYRPLDPAKFSGNTVVEWGNVSMQVEAPADFQWIYQQVFASGDAYVQVSAQQASVCGTLLSGATNPDGNALCVPTSLKGVDPVRYRTLTIPGDAYSYDIFSQAAQAIRHPVGISPLNGLAARHLIAIGASQSAVALNNYIRFGADDAAEVFDGFIIDADGQSTEPTAYQAPTITVWSEETARPAPVLEGANHVTWSIAGAAHTDHWVAEDALQTWAGHTLFNQPRRSKSDQDTFVAANSDYGQEGPSSSASCLGDDEFPRHYVVDAALSNVEIWANGGPAAPTAPPLQFTDSADRISRLPPVNIPGLSMVDQVNWLRVLDMPYAIARDDAGNALGGLRLPMVTVPVAHYDGTSCYLFGTTTPFTPEVLHSLYPSHTDYVDQMITATKASVAARYLTRPDAMDLLARACDSAIPEWGHTPSEQQPAMCHDLEEAVG